MPLLHGDPWWLFQGDVAGNLDRLAAIRDEEQLRDEKEREAANKQAARFTNMSIQTGQILTNLEIY